MPNPTTAEAATEITPEGADVYVQSANVQVDTPTDSVEDIIEALPGAIKETKEGHKTTEFWLTLVGSVLVLLNGIPAPESKEAYIIGALLAVYTASRGIAKKGVPYVEPA